MSRQLNRRRGLKRTLIGMLVVAMIMPQGALMGMPPNGPGGGNQTSGPDPSCEECEVSSNTKLAPGLGSGSGYAKSRIGLTTQMDTYTSPHALTPQNSNCPPKFAGDTKVGLTKNPIHLCRGAVSETVTDLSLPGPTMKWSHRRSYDSCLDNISLNDQGERWSGGGKGMYLCKSDPTDPDSDIGCYDNASTMHKFACAGSETWTCPSYMRAKLVRKNKDTSNEEYELTMDDSGVVMKFYGINSDSGLDNVRGQLKSITRPGVTSGVSRTYHTSGTNAGMISSETTAQGWQISYSYTSSRLTKIEVKDGSSNVIQEVEYTYWDSKDHHADVGTSRDLVQAKVSRLASDGTNWITRTTQYRYHVTKTGPGDGRLHQLKSVFESDAIERVIAGTSVTSADNMLTVADSVVEDYASRSFTYYTSDLDTATAPTPWNSGANEDLETAYGGSETDEFDANNGDGMVKTETISGACASCGSSGSAGVKKSYFYMDLNGGETESDHTKVARIIVEDTEDANGDEVYRRIWGVNAEGITLRETFISGPTVNASSGLSVWCLSTTLNSDRRTLESRMPSAHSGQVTSNATIKKFLDPTTSTNDADTQNTTGLIYCFEYDSNGYPNNEMVKQGKNGTKYYLRATDWTNYGANGGTNYKPATTYAYPTRVAVDGSHTNRGDGIETTYAYTFWDDGAGEQKLQLKKVTTTLPAISTSQNGSGTATTTERYFDTYGRLRWTRDGDGYVNYVSYHPDTGGEAYTMVDVDDPASPGSEITSGSSDKWEAWTVGDANSNKPTRSSGLPTGLELVSKTEFDDQGRVTKSIDAGGSEHVTKYYNNGTARFAYVSGTTAELPVQVSLIDDGGQLTETFAVKPSAFATNASSIPTTTSNYVSRTGYSYDADNGQLKHVDRYYDIANSKKYRITFIYDEMGRRAATIQDVDTESATKNYQVSLSLFDVWGRVAESYQAAVATKPANYAALFSGGNPVSSFAKLSVTEYDSDGVGDGHVTKQTQYHTSSVYTEMTYKRTYRGHVRGMHREYTDGSTSDVKPFSVVDIDWLGRATAAAVYDTEPATWPADYTDYVSTTSSGRYGMTKTNYDDLGRVYQTLRYPGTQSTKWFEVNSYYDRRGNLVASGDKYGAHQEMAYDGAGRKYQSRTVSDVSATTPYTSGEFDYNAPEPDPDFGSMTGGDGNVIMLSHSEFNSSGSVIATHQVEVNHNDTNGFSLTIGKPAGGVRTTTHSYFDHADRPITSVYYGAGDHDDGATSWKTADLPTRATGDSTTFESNANRLVTQNEYNADSGRLELVKDPEHTSSSSSQNKTLYDDLGRRTYEIENYVNFDPANISTTVGGGTHNEEDRVIGFAYDGNSSTIALTAYNKSASTGNQATSYEYADTHNTRLNTKVTYPDSSGANDVVTMTYNLDGSLATREDQRDVVLTYDYDSSRRVELEKATSIPSGVDDHVQSIVRAVDDYGRPTTVTSYAGTTTATTVRNQIEYTYNTYGLVSDSDQEHSGAVNGSTPEVDYDYETDHTSNVLNDGLRLDVMNLPLVTNAKVSYFYANSFSERLNRVRYAKLHGGSFYSGQTQTSKYEYNGTGRMVETWAYVSSGGGTNNVAKLTQFSGSDYNAFDRFGRVTKQKWYWSGTTHSQTDYVYDYNSNRTERNVTGAATLDQDYVYDGLDRLRSVDEDSGSSTNDRYWELDQLGNWEKLRQGTTDSSTLLDTRTHNDVNELTASTANANPAYDAAGNMTTIPQPASMSNTFTATYDAWNRLVLLEDGSNDVQQNRYDGLHRRIIRHDDTNDDGNLNTSDDMRHYYWNEKWQCVVEGVDSGSGITGDAIYSHHPHYIDAVAARMRSTDGHYYLHDANFNVVALMGLDTGTKVVVERYHYSPYGEVSMFDASWTSRSSSSYANELLYTGRRLDPETLVYQYRYRYYHAEIGRFVARDPIGYRGGNGNLHEYVTSSPLGRSDPSGLKGQKCEASVIIYDGQDEYDKKYGWAGGESFRCAAQGLRRRCVQESEGDNPAIYSYPIAGLELETVLKAFDSGKNCCIKHLFLVDHCGLNDDDVVIPGTQQIGDKILDKGMIDSICSRLCPGATVTLYGCKAGRFEQVNVIDGAEVPSTAQLLMKHCDKVQQVEGCTENVEYKDLFNEHGCINDQNLPNVIPKCLSSDGMSIWTRQDYEDFLQRARRPASQLR